MCLENQLPELTSLVRQLAVGKHQQPTKRVCEICTSVEHPTDMCPTLMRWSARRQIPIWKITVSKPAVAIPAESESRATYSTKIWTSWGHAGFESRQLSIGGTNIPAPVFRQQPQQQMTPQPNSSSMEDLVKQILECNLQFQQNITVTIHDLKMQVGQLVDTSAGFGSIPLQTISNSKREESTWHGYKTTSLSRVQDQLELSPRPVRVESEPGVDSRVQQLAKSVSLPFPNCTISARRSKIDEDLLKLFRKVDINIPLLNRSNKSLNTLSSSRNCVHKRKKMKGAVEK
ncbi:hypothetical protein CR513_50885, partial [Mucuna pruriens]